MLQRRILKTLANKRGAGCAHPSGALRRRCRRGYNDCDLLEAGQVLVGRFCHEFRPKTMSDARDFDGSTELRDVVAALLVLVLPAERRDLIPRLTAMVSACKGVVEHRGKLWGELSEDERNIVAHRVGAIAREVLGTGRTA